jgi:hypothetical protein
VVSNGALLLSGSVFKVRSSSPPRQGTADGCLFFSDIRAKRAPWRPAACAKRSHPRRQGRYLLHRPRSAAGRVWPPDLRVYLLAGAKVPALIDGMVARPNGLTLTTDGKTLIVDDTIGPTVFAYDVQDDGTARNKRPFGQLHDISAGMESGANGMVLDSDNRGYITTVAGAQVFDTKGQYLDSFKADRQSPAAAHWLRKTLPVSRENNLLC